MNQLAPYAGAQRDPRAPSDKVYNRNRAVLVAAVALAERFGYRTITRQQVAAEAQVAVGSVNNAFGTMDGLRDAVMAYAVQNERSSIVAQGLSDRHPAALNAPEGLRILAAASLAAVA